ncbi:MAG: acyl carrier protein [bacterium]
MSATRHTALKIVTDAVTELNESLEDKIDLSNGEETPIYGAHGVIDSLDLVTLILMIEDEAKFTFGKIISITDDKAMSSVRSPFRTVGSLTDYLTNLAA